MLEKKTKGDFGSKSSFPSIVHKAQSIHLNEMAVQYAKDQPAVFTNKIENVAIVGAGGRLGRILTDAVLKTGNHSITAITRPGSTSKFAEGVNVIYVDYSGDDDTALVAALQGQKALVITMSVVAPRNTTPNLIRAASKAGVKYIFPNWYGHDAANQSLCDDCMLTGMRDGILAAFEGQDTSKHLLINSNFWYEFSLGGGPDRYGFDFVKRSLTLFDGGDTPINTTTWPHVAGAVAGLLSLKELPDDEADMSPTLSQFANVGVYISSFKISQRDMFESVKRVTATQDSDWSISQESSEMRWKSASEAIKQGNYGAFTKLLYSRTFFPNGGGDYESHVSLDNDVLGLVIEDLDEATAKGIRMGEDGEVPH